MDHALTGQIVHALVNLRDPLEEREVRRIIRAHCRARLSLHKVPVKVTVTDEPLATERGKKRRRG
jgi:acyl-coenzyme A synthetase/AMP-(fatty) acid ligase